MGHLYISLFILFISYIRYNRIPIPTYGFICHVMNIHQFFIFDLLLDMYLLHVFIIFIIIFLILGPFIQSCSYVLVIEYNFLVILLYIRHFALNILIFYSAILNLSYRIFSLTQHCLWYFLTSNCSLLDCCKFWPQPLSTNIITASISIVSLSISFDM